MTSITRLGLRNGANWEREEVEVGEVGLGFWGFRVWRHEVMADAVERS